MALDAEARQVYGQMPETFQRRDVDRSFMEPTVVIFERCTIDILYLKGLIVLHRRYISHELQGPTSEPSRRACVEVALDILARQEDLYKAC
jgi:hypothetical protein